MIIALRWPFSVRSFGELVRYRTPQTFDPEGEIVQDPLLFETETKTNEEPVKMTTYVHLRRHMFDHPLAEALGTGGATFAFLEGEELGEKTLSISIAACSDEDTFSRKLGREIADNRLAGENFIAVFKEQYDILEEAFRDLEPYHGKRVLRILNTLIRQGSVTASENFEVDALDYLFRKHLG